MLKSYLAVILRISVLRARIGWIMILLLTLIKVRRGIKVIIPRVSLLISRMIMIRFLILCIGIFIECLLVSVFQKFIMNTLVIWCESLSLPFLKVFFNFWIIFVQLLLFSLLFFVLSLLLLLLFFIDLVKFLLTQCIALLTCFKSRVCFLKLFKHFLYVAFRIRIYFTSEPCFVSGWYYLANLRYFFFR